MTGTVTRARSRRCRSEHGAMTVAAAAIVVMVTIVALLIAVPATQALARKQTTSTAADAAALAAANRWAEVIEDRLGEVVPGDPVSMGAFLQAMPEAKVSRMGLTEEAASLAAANDGELLGLRVDASELTVEVRVRSSEPMIAGGPHAESTAAARVELGGGACLARGHIGLVLDGECTTRLPEAPEPVEPTPGAEDTGEPSEPADVPDMDPIDVDVVLVR